MNCRLILSTTVFAIVSVLLAGIAPNSAAAERPNIVLFMADDVGSEVLGSYGGTSYDTPRIDGLARDGARFTHCYSMPVCHPTRLTIMTGRYPFRNPAGWGRWPKGVQTFADVLGQAGYATAVAGKWQLTFLADNPNHAAELGFDQSALFGWHEGPRFHNPMIYRNGSVWKEKQRRDIYGPDVYTEFLIDFMEENRNRPFLVYYPMALCHEISDDFEPVPPPAPDGHYLSFAEMVADMDAAVGRILDAVDRLGLRKNTVVMFTTDNGSPRHYLTEVEHRDAKIIRRHKPVISLRGGKKVRGGKGSLADAGTRVPLVVRWPQETPAGIRIDDLVDFSDFLPTLADLAGAQLPEDVKFDGRSFAPQLCGEEGNPRDWAYSGLRGRHWVRTECWKLYADGQLFNVCEDAAEKQPIDMANASDEAKAAQKKLQAVLKELGIDR